MSFLRDLFTYIVRKVTHGYSRVGNIEHGSITDRAFKGIFESFLQNVGKTSPDDFVRPGTTSRGNDFTLSKDVAEEIVDIGEGRRYPVRNGHEGAQSPYYLRGYPGQKPRSSFSGAQSGDVTIEIKASNFGTGDINLSTLEVGLRKLASVADRYIGVILLFPLNSVCADARAQIDSFSGEHGIPVYICSVESENWDLICDAMERTGVDFSRIIKEACEMGKRQETYELSFAA